MRLSELPPRPPLNKKPLKGWVTLLISLGLLGLVGGPIYLLSSGFFIKIYPANTEISYNNFMIVVFQVNYRPGKPGGDLLFCNYGLVEVEVSFKVKSLNLFSSSENFRPDQFSLYNAKTGRLYILPTAPGVRQPALEGGVMQVGDTGRGWLTFCPFEPPQNLQLRFMPQHPGKGIKPLLIDLQPAIKTI